MKRFIKVIIGIAILLVGVGIAALLFITKPTAEKKDDVAILPAVETLVVNFETVEISLPSQGIIQAARRTQLSSEVAGKVISVSDKFDPGGTFKEGELLIELDPSDYEAAFAQAKSTLVDMETALSLEEAKVAQAKRDWKSLGNRGEPSELVLRTPQLRGAKAKRDAAEAAVKKAQQDLRRAKITAPFPATISKTNVEKGGYVTPGMPVAEIFQTSPFEVRLPLSIDDAQFLEEIHTYQSTEAVELSATAGGVTREWKGKISRAEGEIDRASRSVYIVAEINPLTAERSGGVNLQPGLFVKAKIKGKKIGKIAKIPFPAFVDLDSVAVVDPDNRLRFREVVVLRRESDGALVSGGLSEGERVSLTELPEMIEGMEVSISPPDDSTEPKKEGSGEANPKL